MSRNVISNAELARLVAAGKSNQEIAQHFGVTVGAVRNKRSELGMVRPQLDHSEALPWKLNQEERRNSTAAQYLVILSTIAQGKTVSPDRRNKAFKWAQATIARGMDVTAVDGKLIDVRADKDRPSHIETVYNKAIAKFS